MSSGDSGRVRGDEGYMDEGYMTVIAAFAVAAVLVITVGVLLVGRAAVAAHSARSAADLAALAGAHALRAGEDPCAVAAEVASANRAVAARCAVDGYDVVIRADVRVELGLLGSRTASAVARAGPA
ncbi:Rv3654c family TadE-like protein [Rhodococcus sp. IEGM 1408]|uniref:Rv3654c family TadE-like protein n=1 Tax=Rhodococcus sp. IEGM 1408 TaxID=3082220 RepID=UPI002952C394|nr:Rv3654c family TadE-like protein [Rhodococcus sp. IEGM 1408]MDV8002253.1 flp pilus-assembly TadE/G-like family protein [Rhodococcus sp. IEGM 1408]